MNVALCCVGRLENMYAVEFVEYYKNIGINHIYIGDNNYNGEEYFEDVLQQYINDNFVTIIPIRNKQRYTLYFYTIYYRQYHTLYDYIIFIDFDEYITLNKDNSIQEYLLRNKNYNVIQLNWITYTDNNLVYNDGRPLLERFTKPMELYKHVQYSFPENYHTKCIVKCEFEDIVFDNNPHVISLSYKEDINNYKICNSSFKDKQNFEFTWGEFNKDCSIEYSLAYIKHFTTKTIDEYVTNKLKKGCGDISMEAFNNDYGIDRFFKYNEVTDEKIQYCINNNIKIYEDTI